jgi:hypothetical protein
MWQANRGVCAVGLLVLSLSGCTLTDCFSLAVFQGGKPGGDRIVAGSLETVAESTKNALTQLGMAAVVSRNGEAIQITSTTKGGAKFLLVLTREKTKDGEQTRVHIDWLSGSDEQTAFQILSQVDVQSRR